MAVAPLGALANPLLALAGYAVGTGVGPLLRPPIQDLINFSWSQHPVRPLDARTAAALWVEGEWDEGRAYTEGEYTGVSNSRVRALKGLVDSPPDIATLFALWRRNLIGADDFIRGLKHLRIEPEFYEALRQTHNVLISPAQLAAMRQQGYIDRARQVQEAELQGVTPDRADLMFEQAGLPPGPEALLTMLRRGIITEGEFAQGIREGNTKTKYVDEYLALRHPLLTAAQLVNLRLRGWIGTAEMNERGADLGYTADAMHDLFLGQGRPITFRQVFIGERRGGSYEGPTAPIAPAFLKSLQESNIRPEWYNLAWAQRHTIPSAFVIRRLAESGDITPAQTRELLEWSGWPEFLIDAVVTSWSGGTDGVDAALVKSARTQAITEIRSAYILGQADDAQARNWLGRVDVLTATVDELLRVWGVMREVPQKGLTAAQIKSAYKKLPGQWPRERALDELEDLGYTRSDASDLLDS
jgi:hypothetical protein